MSFTSLNYIFFLVGLTILYHTIPIKLKIPLLFFASITFYSLASPKFFVLLIVFILLNYWGAFKLERTRGTKKLKQYFIALVVLNLLPLLFFKYWNFFCTTIITSLGWVNLDIKLPYSKFLLPLGISFFTFSNLGYLIDVYFGEIKPERNIVRYGVYVAFFAHILCGPIPRPKQTLQQLTKLSKFDSNDIAVGSQRILLGFFKKLVIAEKLVPYVDSIFSHPDMHNSLTLILAAFFFVVQLYTDISGYSDIAIGSARLFGFRLLENFRTPYFSTSVSDYWKRNHISLTSWLTDNVFYPLTERFHAHRWNMYINIIITFLISGLWHGASWSFIIWGFLQGCFIVWDQLERKRLKKYIAFCKDHHCLKFGKFLLWLRTFTLLTLSLIFFRAGSLNAAIHYLKNLFSFNQGKTFVSVTNSIPLFLLTLIIFEFNQKTKTPDELIARFPTVIKWLFYPILTFIIILFGALNGSGFLYFQF